MNMMNKPLSCVLLFTLTFFVLSGCLTLDTAITFEEDNSGRVELNYTVSSMVMNLGKLGEEDSFVPLPISENDFIAAARIVEGLDLVSIRTDEDESGVHVEAVMEFDGIEALSAFLFPGEEGSLTLSPAGEASRLRYLIFTPPGEPVPDRSMEMIRTFFAEDSLSFTVTAPRAITGVNRGDVLENGVSTSLNISIPELYESGEEIVWEIQW